MNRFTIVAGIPALAAAVLAAIPSTTDSVEAQAARTDMQAAHHNAEAWVADLNDDDAVWWALDEAVRQTAEFTNNGFEDKECQDQFAILLAIKLVPMPAIEKALVALEACGVESVLRCERTDEHTWVAALLQPGARDAHVDAWGASAWEAVQKLEVECTDWEVEYEELKDIR
jgi:hypothetical protein